MPKRLIPIIILIFPVILLGSLVVMIGAIIKSIGFLFWFSPSEAKDEIEFIIDAFKKLIIK